MSFIHVDKAAGLMIISAFVALSGCAPSLEREVDDGVSSSPQGGGLGGTVSCTFPPEGCGCRVGSTGYMFNPPHFDQAAEELELDLDADGARRATTARQLLDEALQRQWGNLQQFGHATGDWWNVFIRDAGDRRVSIQPAQDDRFFERDTRCDGIATGFMVDEDGEHRCDRFNEAAYRAFSKLRHATENEFRTRGTPAPMTPADAALRCIPYVPKCFRTTQTALNFGDS